MFDQFTSRNPIPEFLWVQMEVECETVNFILGLFQFQLPPHSPLQLHLLNRAKGIAPTMSEIRLITFRDQFLKRSP